MKGGGDKALRRGLRRGEPGAVHEARKLSRAVGAELALVGGGRRQRRAWRDLRRAVAPLRDHDVTGEHVAAALERLNVPAEDLRHFQEAWAARRVQVLEAAALPDLPERPKRPGHLKKRARAALEQQARQLAGDAPGVLRARDPAVWHDWRKSLKRYRYTLDVLGRTPEVVKATLDALGRMQDAEVVLHAVTDPDWPGGQQAALKRQESAARTRARAQVRRLWPELAAHLNAVEEAGGKWKG